MRSTERLVFFKNLSFLKKISPCKLQGDMIIFPITGSEFSITPVLNDSDKTSLFFKKFLKGEYKQALILSEEVLQLKLTQKKKDEVRRTVKKIAARMETCKMAMDYLNNGEFEKARCLLRMHLGKAPDDQYARNLQRLVNLFMTCKEVSKKTS